MPETYTAFASGQVIANGEAGQIAVAVLAYPDVLIFADRTGQRVEVDRRTGRLALPDAEAASETAP
ncbi:MAG: hypothetical protein ABW360_12020, partial [Phenylobacterium sp.]